MVKKIYEMNESEINDFIKERMPVRKKEKDKYGEVFTNPVLIEKMLDLFPEKIWQNSCGKWLDPSVGKGFFMIFVYLRLMKGLAKWEPNDKKRSKWILRNMLYMVELNKENCDTCKKLFGSDLRLFCADFLSDFATLPKFDYIIGNPPFQDDYTGHKSSKRILGGKNKLYERIFLKAFGLLKDDGWLSMVVPDNIFSGNGVKSYNILINNKLPFVSFNSKNQSYFDKINQPVCYFIVQKTGHNNAKTRIENTKGEYIELLLKDRPANPIRDWTNKTEQLINKYVSNKRNQVKYNRGKTIKSYKGTKYKLIFTPKKMLSTDNEAVAPGRLQKKAIIFSISPTLEFKMDYEGKFGAGPNTFWIPFSTITEGKRLEQFLKSDEYKTLALATKTNRQFLKLAFIEHLKIDTVFNKGNQKQTNKLKNKYNHNKNTRKQKK